MLVRRSIRLISILQEGRGVFHDAATMTCAWLSKVFWYERSMRVEQRYVIMFQLMGCLDFLNNNSLFMVERGRLVAFVVLRFGVE
jgi:hypothetical protein